MEALDRDTFQTMTRINGNNLPVFWLASILALLVVGGGRRANSWPVKSYKDLRYKHVRLQNTLSSCGPASLATLMSDFYGAETPEKEVVELVKPYLDEEIEKLKEGEVPEGGVSMLDLKRVSRELGVPAKGYEIPQENLTGILERLKTPLLLYLEQPEEHFVLAVGSHRGKVILADPSLGIRSIGRNELFDKWDGLILAFSPNKKYRSRAQKVVEDIKGRAGQRSQTKSLAREFLWGIRN